jgi:hypothetical protein
LYLLITPFVPSDNPFVIFIFPFLISSNFFLCGYWDCQSLVRRRVNQNPYVEEGQTTQWPKEKVKRTNNDLQNIHIKHIVTRTPLKTGAELSCPGRVDSSCYTSDTRRVYLVTYPVISHEWGKDREVFTTSGTYPWSFVTHIFHSGQPSHGDDVRRIWRYQMGNQNSYICISKKNRQHNGQKKK